MAAVLIVLALAVVAVVLFFKFGPKKAVTEVENESKKVESEVQVVSEKVVAEAEKFINDVKKF